MAMRFCILGSGSAGNCALVESAKARVLLDDPRVIESYLGLAGSHQIAA